MPRAGMNGDFVLNLGKLDKFNLMRMDLKATSEQQQFICNIYYYSLKTKVSYYQESYSPILTKRWTSLLSMTWEQSKGKEKEKERKGKCLVYSSLGKKKGDTINSN